MKLSDEWPIASAPMSPAIIKSSPSASLANWLHAGHLSWHEPQRGVVHREIADGDGSTRIGHSASRGKTMRIASKFPNLLNATPRDFELVYALV